MQIVSNGQRRNLQNALQVFDGLFEEAVAFCVPEVPDMLREKGVPALGQADSVLQLAADGQYRWHFLAQKNWHRNESARAPQLPRTPAGDAGNGIVTAQQNVAVVDKKTVSQPVQSAHRFVVGDANRLFAEVGTGHNKRHKATVREQQMVQRRVRQKHSQIAIERRNIIANRRFLAPSQQDDRPLRAEQQLLHGIVHFAEQFSNAEIRNHYGERLLDALLALAQGPYCVLVGGVASKVETSQALDADHVSLLQARNGFSDRIARLDGLSV